MKKIGVYIHIPFCKQKCIYCDFLSFACKENIQKEYIEALKKEIINWKLKNNNVEIKTIYIGGGTPSFIDSKYIVEIMQILKTKEQLTNLKPQFSTTIEINPGTVSQQKLLDYKKAGINRISIGLQSTENHLLKLLGRIHNFDDFLSTYSLAKKLKYDNINVDLMIGLPTQTIQDIKKSLQKLTSNISIEHISVYSLIVEENTPIKEMIEEGALNLPNEELERQMYWYVKNYLELQGYNHYEISNFAKKGFESKHNMDCWNQEEYIGFGLGAHSYINGTRFCNISNLEEYIINCKNSNFDKNIIVQEVQSKVDKMKEYMILGLRKIDGISIQKFELKFSENPIMFFRDELQKLSEEELIIIDGDAIKLSNKGLDFANIVWEEFV